MKCPKCKKEMILEKYYARDGSSRHSSWQYMWICPSGIHDYIFIKKEEYDKLVHQGK